MWFFVVSFLCIYQIDARRSCQSNPTVRYADLPSSSDVKKEYNRYGTAKYLYCQEQNNVDSDTATVNWYFQKKGGSKWQEFPFCWGQVKFGFRYVELIQGKKNRTLLIHSTGAEAAGMYACVIQDRVTLHSTINYISLELFDCTPGRSEPVVHVHPKEQYAAVGDKISVSCSGVFGCDENNNSVEWMILTDQDELAYAKDSKHPNYDVKLDKKNNGHLLNSTLTITVREEDFTTGFRCMVSSESNYDKKPLLFKFQLKPKVIVEDHRPATERILVVVVPSLIGVLVVFAILIYFFGPCICLKCRILHGHTQTAKEKETNEFDIVIFHDDDEQDDRDLVLEIFKKLQDKGVRVATVIEGEDIKPGGDEQNQMQELLVKSASAIFLLPETTKCYKMENLFQFAKNTGVVPLAYIFIVSSNKKKKTYVNQGILAKGLQHFNRPIKLNLDRFCYKIMAKLPLYNKGEYPQDKVAKDRANQKREYNNKKDFNNLKFQNCPDDAGEPLLNMEEEERGLNKDKVNIDDIEMENVIERVRNVEDGDESEEDSTCTTVSTQAEVHHSNSSIESLLRSDFHSDDKNSDDTVIEMHNS